MKAAKYAKRMVIGGGTLLVLAFIVLNCSGLVFPLRGAQVRLEQRFLANFGVGLPVGAKVIKGARVAERDWSEFYWVEMTPADVVTWAAALEAATKKTIEDRSPYTQFAAGNPGPDWYQPQKLPDMKVLKMYHCWVFYSLTSGRVFIYWFTT